LVVAGTGVPVIAVALVVALPDFRRRFPTFREDRPLATFAGFAIALWSVAFTGMIVIMVFTLDSLALYQNQLSLRAAIYVMVLVLMALFFVTVLWAFIRRESSRVKSPAQAGKGPAKADEGKVSASDDRDRRRVIKRGLVGSSPVRRRPGRG
jgi:lysylphosphatidylglycerol synthetase-like protein (DUF2156 family)